MGWTVVLELTDNDTSISKADVYREDFEKLIKALVTGKTADGKPVRGVIVAEQERIARRFSDWERFTDALTFAPGRVYAQKGSSRDPYSDGFMWEGAAGMVGAKSEPRKISERTTRSHRARAERGKSVGGNRPFGWLPDRRTLDKDESAHAAKIIRDFIAGKSIHSITRDLQERGVLTSLGNRWTTDSLRKYLGNPRVCGWRILHEQMVIGPDGEPVVGEWQPIVTPEEWLAVKAKLDRQKGQNVGPNGILGPTAEDHGVFKYLLTGVARCGKPKPDGTLCLAKLRKNEQPSCKGHIYVCQSKGMGGCAGIGRNGIRLDAFVTEAVLAKLEKESLEAAKAEPWGRDEEWERALAARADLMSAWNNGNGTIPNDTFFTHLLPGVEAQIRELRSDRERYMAAVAEADAAPVNVRQEWEDNEDISWRRSIIARAVSAVIVKPVPKGTKVWVPGSVDILWKQK